MTRAGVFVADLAVEETWARAAGLAPRPPSAAAAQRAARLGLLAAALRPDLPALWTPRPVAPAGLERGPRIPRPRLLSGPPRPPVPDPTRAWGDPRAFAVNHRRLAHELERRHGAAPPGACFVDRLEALVSAARGMPAWVLKTPYGAAGRGRVFGRGAALDGATTRRVDRLLAEQGELLLEPWLPRAGDFGAVHRDGEASLHRLLVDARGRFRGIAPLAPGDLAPEEERALRAALDLAGDALAGAGYTGPFGVDAFRYRGEDGASRFRPLAEINARFTFGHVARAWGELLGGAWARAGLHLGSAPPVGRGTGVRTLLRDPAGGPPGAWLALDPMGAGGVPER